MNARKCDKKHLKSGFWIYAIMNERRSGGGGGFFRSKRNSVTWVLKIDEQKNVIPDKNGDLQKNLDACSV